MSSSIPSSTPGGTWQPPSVEEMQAMLPQYQFVALLGRGGMGAVYKAVQVSLEREVAIKVLPGDLLDDADVNFTERFKNEARTMAKMKHPGIVDVYDFGEADTGRALAPASAASGDSRRIEDSRVSETDEVNPPHPKLLYFVMEFIDGTDVSKMIIQQGRLPSEHALAITAHVCDALQYAHSRGVIHRDIKPANILIDMEGRVKVADFGLAKQSDPGVSGLTKTNMAMGTPDFVAPEALIAGIPLDGRADLYAVGVMLYNMLTGEIPRGLWMMPSLRFPGMDRRFDAIIARAMQTDREARYQSATEIRHDLNVILTVPMVKDEQKVQQATASPAASPQSTAQSRRPGVAQPARPANAPKAGRAGATPGLRTSQPSAKSKTPLLIGIAAAVIIGGGLVFMMSGKKPADAEAAAGNSDANASGTTNAPSRPAEVAAPSTTNAPSSSVADFAKQVAAAATPEQQIELVTARLKEINGCDFVTDYKDGTKIDQGKVIGLCLRGTKGTLADLSPIAALKDLASLKLFFLRPGDLGVLRGLQLSFFWAGDCRSTDLSVFKGMPLRYFNFNVDPQSQAGDVDLSPLAGAPLEQFIVFGDLPSIEVLKSLPLKGVNINGNKRITSLEPLRGKALSELRVQGTGITDLALLRDMPLGILYVDDAVARTPANRAIIEGIASLTKINDKPPAEFWKALDAMPAAVVANATAPATTGTAATATKDAPFVNSLGMKFVPVPGTRASFSVWLTRVQDYAVYAAANPQVDGSWKTQDKEGAPIGRESDHPVVAVSWDDAQAFCAWLTAKEQAEGKLTKDMKYRLPGDEEWSTAVGLPPEQGATPEAKDSKNTVDFPWGKAWPPPAKAGNYADETFHAQFPKPDSKNPRFTNPWIAGYTDGYATTSPVGSFAANAHGLHDMGGNVWQWCEDAWNAASQDRVLRGNSFPETRRERMLSSARHHTPPGVRYNNHGFRCVLSSSAGAVASSPPPIVPAPSQPALGTGIRDLFNGRDFTGWTGPGGVPATATWTVQGGVFSTTQRTTLWSEENFGDFEFEIEWKVGPKGNGGVFYHVPGANELEAPELQLADPTNAGSSLTGSLFSIVKEKRDASKPVGEWNTAKLVARGPQREHWINGELVCSYDVSSADFRQKLGASRMKDKITFATNRGKFVLQANAGEVSYRNARIRVPGIGGALAATSPATPTSALPTPNSSDPRLAQLEAAFKTDYAAKAQQTYEASVAALNTSYVGALGRARTAAQTKGVLAEVSAMDDELKRIQTNQGVPAADEANAPATLTTLRKTYRTTIATHAATRDKAAAPVYDAYLKALDDYIKELTRADKLEDAKRVKAVRDSVAAQKPSP